MKGIKNKTSGAYNEFDEFELEERVTFKDCKAVMAPGIDYKWGWTTMPSNMVSDQQMHDDITNGHKHWRISIGNSW